MDRRIASLLRSTIASLPGVFFRIGGHWPLMSYMISIKQIRPKSSWPSKPRILSNMAPALRCGCLATLASSPWTLIILRRFYAPNSKVGLACATISLWPSRADRIPRLCTWIKERCFAWIFGRGHLHTRWCPMEAFSGDSPAPLHQDALSEPHCIHRTSQ